MRFHVEPRDVPRELAARRIGLTLPRFDAVLADLVDRGFPPADATTGNFDLDAIDEWRKRRHPDLFKQQLVATSPAPAHSTALVRDRLRSAPWAGSR